MKSKTNKLKRKQERSCFAPTPVEFPSSSDPGREQSQVVPQGLGTLANPILGIINSVRQKIKDEHLFGWKMNKNDSHLSRSCFLKQLVSGLKESKASKKHLRDNKYIFHQKLQGTKPQRTGPTWDAGILFPKDGGHIVGHAKAWVKNGLG